MSRPDVWASGAASTVLRTTNGGESWQRLTVTTDQLDFRDIDAIDETTAYVLSIGNGWRCAWLCTILSVRAR